MALNCNRLMLQGRGVGARITFDFTGNVTIEKCVVMGFEIGINNENCVLCTIQKNEVSNNHLRDNGRDGIVVGESCAGNVLTNNATSGNGGGEIVIEQEGNTVVTDSVK